MMMQVPARKVGVEVGVVEQEMLAELVGEMEVLDKMEIREQRERTMQLQPHNVKMLLPKGVEEMFKLAMAVAEEMLKLEMVLVGEEMFKAIVPMAEEMLKLEVLLVREEMVKVAVPVAEQMLPHMLELVGEGT